MKTLSEEEKTRLLLAARVEIARRLGRDGRLPDADGSALQEERGTFVTLKKDGDLRGCIGNIEPAGSLWESVRRNALAAAFNDYRFAPLAAEELDQVVISISVLSPAERLDFRDAADLEARLRPGVDGVILRSGRNSATFLPQVWEQLPETARFLDHLCLKAGLPRGFWRGGEVEVATYQVEHFAEEPR